MGVGPLKYILSGCKTSLTQGCYTWRHNQVFKSFVCLFENKQVEVNSLPVNDRDSRMSFVQEGQKSGHQAPSIGKWGKAWDWRLLANVGRQLQNTASTVIWKSKTALWSKLAVVKHLVNNRIMGLVSVFPD